MGGVLPRTLPGKENPFIIIVESTAFPKDTSGIIVNLLFGYPERRAGTQLYETLRFRAWLRMTE
jgi:hypothetical protein